MTYHEDHPDAQLAREVAEYLEQRGTPATVRALGRAPQLRMDSWTAHEAAFLAVNMGLGVTDEGFAPRPKDARHDNQYLRQRFGFTKPA